MSDLMDTSKVEKARSKAEDGGSIENNYWTCDGDKKTVVKHNGKTITATEIIDDESDMGCW